MSPELSSAHTILAITAVFGVIIGSFINVVISRLPVMQERYQPQFKEPEGPQGAGIDNPAPRLFNLARPASICGYCGHRIRLLENIPILSYFFLRGHCTSCHHPIPIRYLLVEGLTGLLYAVVVWRFGLTPLALGGMTLTAVLLALSFIDFEHQLLPDSLTLPCLWLGLTINLFTPSFVDIESAVIGVVAGYLTLWVIFHIFHYFTGREGMGYGDFKLLAMLGAWLGWEALPAIVFLSSLIGIAVGGFMVFLRKHHRSTPLAFGPYLALAGWLWMISGE